MEIENEFMMSQDGYASIDFTLLDRPNNDIASAPEATAVLLPDEHAMDSSFPSFDLLDGSGVVGSYGYAGEGDDNQALEQSRDGSEKEFYKEQAMHSSVDNEVGGSNAEYGEYQTSQSVPKPVSSLDFFAKNQDLQPQVQQSQLNLFGSDLVEENQEFFESNQASQQSQSTGSSWWMPDSSWAATNNQRNQSQVYNWASMNEEQRRSMRLRMGGPKTESEYPGAMYSMPLVVNSDPTPSMYSFLPANTHEPHKILQQADAARVQALQSSSAGKNPQYDFPGPLNGSGYQQGRNVAQTMSLMEQQRYRAMVQVANGSDQQLQMQEARNREQQLRMQEASSREQQLREQQQIREQHLRDHQAREQHFRDQQLRLQEASIRGKKLRVQEASSREQQLRLQGHQNQRFSKYENQSMEVSPLKFSDYDFLGGGDYTMKGQGQSEVRQQLNEGDDQPWRPQQQQLAARQQPQHYNAYGNSSYEDMHQRQQVQEVQETLTKRCVSSVRNPALSAFWCRETIGGGQTSEASFLMRQRLQHQAHQQQLLGGNQSRASGNQFQGFLGEGLLQDLPQVMQKQPERVNSPQTSADGHNVFVLPNVQAVNQNSGGSMMYNPQNEGGAVQGPINYLLEQDNSFSWHQLAMKASGLDQPMHASAANSGKAGQQLNSYANAQGGAMPGSLGVVGKHSSPAGQINRPIPRSLRAGPLPLLGMDGRADGQDYQASKARMLFGHAMQQQQQQPPSQAAKQVQVFPGHAQQGNYMAGSTHALEEAHRRHGLNLRGNAVEQDGAPHVKLFAQSLTSMDPIQQQQQQQHLMAASRNARNPQSRHASILQQSALQMAQERNYQLGASPGHQYQQGVNQAGSSFLHNAADRNQQAMWNNYEIEADASEVEVPVMVPGNLCSLLKSSSWSGGSEAHPVPQSDNSLTFERSRIQQQNVWEVHGVQRSNSQPSGDIGPGLHNTQSGSVVQQGTPKSSGGHPLDSQANGELMHQSSLQPGAPMLNLSEMEANVRQNESQNSQEETNWRNHSLLQASSQLAAASNAPLQAITETDRAQMSWKSLWQSVQNPGNSGQLGEPDNGPPNTLWGQNRSYVSGPQSELSDETKARMALNVWGGGQGAMQADAGKESHRGTKMEQQVMVSGSPLASQGFQDVEGRQQLSNQGLSFQEALSQASLSDNNPSSTSQHVDQNRQNATSFAQPVDREGSAVNSSDPGGHSTSSKEAMHYPHYAAKQQALLNKGNLENHGNMNAWAAETRQRFDDTSVSAVDSSGQQEDTVQVQLSNQQAENTISSLMSARGNIAEEFLGAQPVRALNAASGYGHPSKNGRPGMLTGPMDGSMGGLAHSQMGANQMQIQQSILAGRALQTNNVAGNAGKVAFLPSRPDCAADDQSTYTNSMLAQRARYSGRRDVADPGRNTLELLHQSEQGEEIADALVDQDGSAAEGGAGPSVTSLAHLRLGHMGNSLLQRPTPSRAEFPSKEQMEPQGARNVERWSHGRNLQQEFMREDDRAYAQSQMQAHNIRGAQLQGENMARPGLMQERVGMNPAFVGANRHFPSDMSRQMAANICKNLSEAAKIQFRLQLHQQQLANQQRAQQNQRASVGGHPMDLFNMSSSVDPRTAAQQHMSRAGYPESPAMAAGMSPDKLFVGSELSAGPPGQGDVGLPKAQSGVSEQSQQPAPDAPTVKKRKEFLQLVPWRTTISQGSTNLPTTSRAEMEWGRATNSNPDQERFNDAVETLDVTAVCVKRAKRRFKFTTQLMQQLVPALPCQLFKGTGWDDYKSASFVLAKFAVSEACWLSTGLSRGGSGAVAVEDSAEMSDEDDSTVKSDQLVAVVKQGSPVTLSSKLRTQLQQKMTELQDELSRLESAPTASTLSMELLDLDKMVMLNRMARIHGLEILGGLSNPSESPHGKLESLGEAPLVYSPENAYPERFVASVVVPQKIPENLMLFPL